MGCCNSHLETPSELSKSKNFIHPFSRFKSEQLLGAFSSCASGGKISVKKFQEAISSLGDFSSLYQTTSLKSTNDFDYYAISYIGIVEGKAYITQKINLVFDLFSDGSSFTDTEKLAYSLVNAVTENAHIKGDLLAPKEELEVSYQKVLLRLKKLLGGKLTREEFIQRFSKHSELLNALSFKKLETWIESITPEFCKRVSCEAVCKPLSHLEYHFLSTTNQVFDSLKKPICLPVLEHFQNQVFFSLKKSVCPLVLGYSQSQVFYSLQKPVCLSIYYTTSTQYTKPNIPLLATYSEMTQNTSEPKPLLEPQILLSFKLHSKPLVSAIQCIAFRVTQKPLLETFEKRVPQKKLLKLRTDIKDEENEVVYKKLMKKKTIDMKKSQPNSARPTISRSITQGARPIQFGKTPQAKTSRQQNFTFKKTPQVKQAPEPKERKEIVLKLNMGPNKVEEVMMNRDENPSKVASDFGRRFNFSKMEVKRLAKDLQSLKEKMNSKE